MEVHHHTHTARKKWHHYFWEFLMLFLAVFCGYLAEYQLEHTIEHQREKKYAQSLLEDLKKDKADFNFEILWWKTLSSRIDTIHQELYKSLRERNPLILYRQAGFIRTYVSFQYNDRTIEQFKNAGNFRLLRKQNVADSLIVYDSEIKSRLRNVESVGNTIFTNINFLQDEIFDTRYFALRANTRILDSLLKVNPEIFNIEEEEKKKIFGYSNHLHFYKGNITIRLVIIQDLFNKANKLIEMIRKEYRLK
jgi:hypothetical protein